MKNNAQNKSGVSSTRAARRQSRQRSQTIRTIAITGGVLAALVIIVVIVSSTSRPTGLIEGVQEYPNQERGHTSDPVEYAILPPVGGVHNSAWLNCGVYSQPVQDENAVHSLEHGAIWIAFRPGLDQAEVAKLATLTRQSGFRLMSPYPDLSSPIVLSAWGYQLHVDNADDPRVTAFIEKYERNPAGPEPGAPCTGGIGEPG